MISMFTILEDGAWHTLKEIAEETAVPIEKLASYCENISKNQVTEYDAEAKKVRLGNKMKNMIIKLKAEDEAEWERLGAGTIIIPPQKTFQIQQVTIQNMTEQALQFQFTFNKKLNEIIISNI